jgi:hypothetical protein
MKIIEGRARVAASDVANFLACQQLTQLDLQKARGTLQPPHARDLGFEDLVRRGEEHERAVLERFWADGYEVADLSGAADPAGTIAAAIRNGADVIYQGTLTGAGDATALLGRPDFLVRADLLGSPDGEPRLGGRHYEVVDAKLARTAKARAVLQTAFYSRLLAELQGIEPRWMHLALGHGEFVSFKVRDFAAYERQTRRRLVQVLGDLAGSVDTLFVDEAGQMSLANVLAISGAARNLVLLGDPQQLAQPSQAAHPPGAGRGKGVSNSDLAAGRAKGARPVAGPRRRAEGPKPSWWARAERARTAPPFLPEGRLRAERPWRRRDSAGRRCRSA